MKYIVGIGHINLFNGVCSGINCTDTDYVSLSVGGPNGQVWSKTSGPYNWHKNDRTDINLFSPSIDVPDDVSAQLKISWAVINRGHSNNAAEIQDAINKAADAYTASNNNGSATLMGAIIGAVKLVAGAFGANCDGSLYHGTEIYDGHALATGGPTGYTPGAPPDIAQVSPDEWYHVYDYPNLDTGCDNGHYNQVVWIARTP